MSSPVAPAYPSRAARPTPVARLAAALPLPEASVLEAARRETRERPLAYPVGSGQGEEIAMAAGFRPLIRQLLDRRSLEMARDRFTRAGFVTGVAPRVYGPTHDGWDETAEPLSPDAPGARRALFVGRKLGVVQEAIACDLAKTDEADRELGRLLGYPRCCVEAFVVTSRQRRNIELYAGALGRTAASPKPRLNGLDLAVFHYISWTPCGFDCALSSAYADAVAARLSSRHPSFVASIDHALSAHRLVLLDEVQLSLRGHLREGRSRLELALEHVAPAARDRHPQVPLDADSEEAVARALVLLRGASMIALDPKGLVVDDVLCPSTESALLVPFGAARSAPA